MVLGRTTASLGGASAVRKYSLTFTALGLHEPCQWIKRKIDAETEPKKAVKWTHLKRSLRSDKALIFILHNCV